MLTLKSQLTYSNCSKIFRDPIFLPCEDSICREHLYERDVVKQNKIKCKKCSEEFQVKEIEVKSNETFTQLIESQSYLNAEEKSLKLELELSIKKLFDFYDEFVQNKSILESEVYHHFQEMRFQIDQQREELKVRIDEIALALIDRIKKYEESFSKDKKKHFSSFDDSQSLETE